MVSTPLLEAAELISRERVAPGFWCLGFRSPEIARRARPAHYVAIDLPGTFSVRLPLGIWTARDDTFTLLFREWGERTTRLACIADHEPLSIIGPLGNEFSLPDTGKRAVIVAGGIGVVPFWLLVRELLAAKVRTTVVLGARSKHMLVGVDELRALGADVKICTDDGSAGTRATALDLARELAPPDVFYGCGPPPLLRALSEHANAAGIPCQISMEETFGCSMGTCWGCVVPIRRGSPQAVGYPHASDEKREYDFARVCVDGTVFWSREILWNR
jgi:dihydroorotate dehydrogenase electron transfer subunit